MNTNRLRRDHPDEDPAASLKHLREFDAGPGAEPRKDAAIGKTP